jgi:hypothetical protein
VPLGHIEANRDDCQGEHATREKNDESRIWPPPSADSGQRQSQKIRRLSGQPRSEDVAAEKSADGKALSKARVNGDAHRPPKVGKRLGGYPVECPPPHLR